MIWLWSAYVRGYFPISHSLAYTTQYYHGQTDSSLMCVVYVNADKSERTLAVEVCECG